MADSINGKEIKMSKYRNVKMIYKHERALSTLSSQVESKKLYDDLLVSLTTTRGWCLQMWGMVLFPLGISLFATTIAIW